MMSLTEITTLESAHTDRASLKGVLSPINLPNDLGSADTTLSSLLQEAARNQPHHGLLFRSSASNNELEEMRYGRLWDLAQTNAAILLSEGAVEPNVPILLYFEHYKDSIVWYWSVIVAGGIPALLPPPKGQKEARRRELDHLSQLFGHPTVLTGQSSAAEFVAHGGFSVTCIDQLSAPNDVNSVREQITRQDVHHGMNCQDAICTILFTSGSTGPSKAVQFTHRQLLTSSYLKSRTNNMGPNDRFLCWISFDHSVALCELHLQAMAAGANLYMIPGSEFTEEPRRFWNTVSDYRISYTFSPNSFLAAALRAHSEAADRGGHLPAYDFIALKVLFCGGEANRTVTLQAASDFLSGYGAPKNAVTAVYGLSETCSALFYNRNGPAYDTLRTNAFASVGTTLPEHEVRVVDENLQPTSTGAVQLRGPMIFRGYYNNATATESCTTVDGWFDTGDIGSFDDQGNLVISGRSKDVLNLNGEKFSNTELEYAIETYGIADLEPGYTVSFSTWIEEKNTEDIIILFNPANDQMDPPQLRRTIAEINKAVVAFCERRPHLVIPLPRYKLPRSSIGKLSRAELRSSMLAGEFDEFKLKLLPKESLSDSFINPQQAAIARVFSEYLRIPAEELSADLPLELLGIDSLSYLKLRSGIEREFSLATSLPLAGLTTCRTIQEIDDMLNHLEANDPVPYDPIKVLRPTGSRTPLILCHTGNGGFLNYMGLWPLIPDRKIMAFQAPGLEPHQETLTSLDKMLDVYINSIKKHQPLGPYAFFGLCFGGLLAFELAKRLEALGDEVIFCGGLNSPPDVSVMSGNFDNRHHLLFILKAVGMIPYSDIPVLLERLAGVPNDQVLDQAILILSSSTLEKFGLSKDKLELWIKMSATVHKIALEYHGSGYVRTYDAFYAFEPPIGATASDPSDWRDNYIGQWGRHVIGASNLDVISDYAMKDPKERVNRPLRLHCVPGRHEYMTAPSSVGFLARSVNDALLVREAEWNPS